MDRRRIIILISLLFAGVLFVGGLFWRIWKLRQPTQPLPQEHAVAQETGSTEPLEEQEQAQQPATGDTPSWIETNVEVYTAVTILFPPFVQQTAIEQTLKQIEQEYQVKTQWRMSDSMENYYKALITIGKKWSGIDIAIVPSDLWSLFDWWGYHIPFKESLARLYHPLFQKWVDNTEATFLPLWLDPAVTLYDNELFFSQPDLTLSTLQAALLTASKEWQIPLSIGLDVTSWPVLSWTHEPYFGFWDMLYLFIQQAKNTQQERFLDFFIGSTWWNYEKLLTDVDRCWQIYPHLSFLACTTQEHQLGAWFTWMSESSFIKNMSWYSITHFPTPTQDYPVKGWSFVINKHSPQINSALQWAKGMLILQHSSQLWSWAPHLLEAEYATLQTQLIDQDFAPWQAYISKTTLYNSDQPQVNLADDLLLKKVVWGSYNLGLYVQKK